MKAIYPIVKFPKAFIEIINEHPPIPIKPQKEIYNEAEGSKFLNIILIIVVIFFVFYLITFLGLIIDVKTRTTSFYFTYFIVGLIGLTIFIILTYINQKIEIKQIRQLNDLASKFYNQKLNEYKLDCERINHPDNVHKFRKSILSKIKPLEIRSDFIDKRPIGISETKFYRYLKNIYPNEIKHNVYVGDLSNPYQCDLAYISNNIHINIEIDEPYESIYGYPIHYREPEGDGIDDSRDQFFNDSNWIVLRFTESQVVKRPNDCAKVIENILNYLDTLSIPWIFINMSMRKMREKSWTYDEALIFKQNKYRESYLGLVFNYKTDRTKDPRIELDSITVGKIYQISESESVFEFDYENTIYRTSSILNANIPFEFASIIFASQYPQKNKIHRIAIDKDKFNWLAANLGYKPYCNKIYYSNEFHYQ